MTSKREVQLRSFFRTLQGEGERPLTPNHPWYVPILQAHPDRDPILRLRNRILWRESESVDLLTGFRGNGKSTELRRLKRLLEDDGCEVYLIDMINYVLMTRPIELGDFLLSLMAGLAETVERDADLKPLSRSAWERLGNFLLSEVEIESLDLGAEAGPASVGMGLKLKTDVTFKEQVQQRLRGHYTRLVRDTASFVRQIVEGVRKKHDDPNRKVVLLIDSLEQLRGWGEQESQLVQQSVLELFSGQAANLALPGVHVVYTVPPYLSAMAQSAARTLGGNPISRWPNVHVRTAKGTEDPEGLDVMVEIIRKRHPAFGEVFDIAQLHRLARASGGDLRDFFRLVRECLVTVQISNSDRATTDALDRSEVELRREYDLIATDDARWLARVHELRDADLASLDDLPRLVRFLDTNVIMNYLNGSDWYDIHPLALEKVLALAARAPREQKT